MAEVKEKINRIFVAVFMAFILTWIMDGKVQAASPEIPTGYRPYLEWQDSSTAGLKRVQKIYVYANAGETIYFGSSLIDNLPQSQVKKSLNNSFGYDVGTTINSKIAVTLPFSSESCGETTAKNYYHVYGNLNDVLQIEGGAYGDSNIYLFQNVDGVEGAITTWQQEVTGPDELFDGGYKAFHFVAPVTGIYTFRFFGSVYNGGVNPQMKPATDPLVQSGGTVAAWNTTVARMNAGTREVVSGRTFTDVLFWNIGNQGQKGGILNKNVFVLTDDGFEYEVNFNGMDPWGFVFYANKRGLLVSNAEVDDGINYRSLMRSVMAGDNALSDLVSKMGVYLNLIPKNPEEDESYYIFFEEADAEVIHWYTGKYELTSNIMANNADFKNLSFRGLNHGTNNFAYEGMGGYFSFNYEPTEEEKQGVIPTSYEIVLNFTDNQKLMELYGYAAGTVNEVVLSNSLDEGVNTVYWNGRDAFGNVVPSSTNPYKVVSLFAKAGEVHFPLLDVEAAVDGIEIRMINDELNGVPLTENQRYNIYYDNSNSTTYGKKIADEKDNSIYGINSKNGAMKFPYAKGNMAVIDVWSNYRMTSSMNSVDLTIEKQGTISFTGKTDWKYFYLDDSDNFEDPPQHFDASDVLPSYSQVILQYRIVDKDVVVPGGIDLEVPSWQTNDGAVWKNYEGAVTVSIETHNETTGGVETITNGIVLSSQVEDVYTAGAASGSYRYIQIPNYLYVENTGVEKATYPYCEADGMCIIYGLPPNPGDDASKCYQYRIVDRRVPDDAGWDGVLHTYSHTQSFGEQYLHELMLSGSLIERELFKEETLIYEYSPQTFYLQVKQLWDDVYMGDEWLQQYRPKAVRVAVLYGNRLSEDQDKDTEYYVTDEVDYRGVNRQVVWRKIQQIDYLTLYDDGRCLDNLGNDWSLSRLGLDDEAFSGVYPLWKLTSSGYPYFYRVRPVAYSMDGNTFTEEGYWDNRKIYPMLEVPEFYAVTQQQVVQYDELHSPGDHSIYPKAITVTDAPACGEIQLSKVDEYVRPITGTSAKYDVYDGKQNRLYFYRESTGEYRYGGILAQGMKLPTGTVDRVETNTSNGVLTIWDLPIHEYSIVEYEAPEGYFTDNTPIGIRTTDFKNSSEKHVMAGKEYLLFQKLVQHENKSCSILPATGGGGLLGVYAAGILFMSISVTGFICKNFKKKNINN